MGKKDRVMERLATVLSLPKEIVMNLPLVSLTGQAEMLVENYKSILEYTDEQVRVNTASGILRVEGKALRLKQITAESIVVTGTIIKLEYLC